MGFWPQVHPALLCARGRGAEPVCSFSPLHVGVVITPLCGWLQGLATFGHGHGDHTQGSQTTMKLAAVVLTVFQVLSASPSIQATADSCW